MKKLSLFEEKERNRRFHKGPYAYIFVNYNPNSGGLAPPMFNMVDWYPPSSIDLSQSRWLDLGPSGNHLTKTLAGNPTAGIPIDGYSTTYFGGNAALKNLNSSLSQSLTIYMVIRAGTVDSTELMCDGHTSVNRITLQTISGGIFRANAGSNLSSPINTFSKDRVHAIRATIAGASSALYVTDLTGSPVANGNAGAGNMGGLTIGAGNTGANAHTEEIAEVIRYSNGHDEASVQRYLEQKYPSILKRNWTTKDVMMCGDSITQGYGSSNGHGSRETIRRSFETNDIIEGASTLRFVGSQRDKCMSHYGISGKQIQQLSASASAQMSIYQPSFVSLLIGTNDCQGDAGVYHSASASIKYTNLMTVFSSSAPTIPYVICTIPPLANTTHNANVNDLNMRLTMSNGIVETFQSSGMNIRICDLNAALTTNDLSDGVHPSDEGYVKMGNALIPVWRSIYQ